MRPTIIFSGIFILMISVAFNSCTYLGGINGNGNVVSETRDVSSFNKIRVGGAFEVFLTQGSTESLTIEADENLIPLIRTDISGGALIISSRENIGNFKKLQIFVQVKDLKKLDISGACHIKSEGTFNLSKLSLECSGASQLNLLLNGELIRCNLSGAAETSLSGTVSECELELSGAASLYAYDLIAEEIDLRMSGAANAKVHATQSLRVNASGAASAKYKGNPDVHQNVSGAANVKGK
jgi:hypothetical protein